MTAWLILELCEGRSPRKLARDYQGEMENAYWRSVAPNFFAALPPPSPIALRAELRTTLRELKARGIIELRRQTKGAQHGKNQA
jgi:hypothetical protein